MYEGRTEAQTAVLQSSPMLVQRQGARHLLDHERVRTGCSWQQTLNRAHVTVLHCIVMHAV